MKKNIVVFCLFFILCLAVFPDDSEKKNFTQMTVKTGYAAGVYESWLTGNVEFDFLFSSWFGFGAEAGINYGLTYQDIHSTAFLFLKLGGFYIGGGISYEIADSVLPPGSAYDAFATPSNKINPAATTGLLMPIIKLGPGKLGLNASFDWFVTDIPLQYDEIDEDENIIAHIIEQIFSGLGQTIMGVIASGKLNLELSYTFSL